MWSPVTENKTSHKIFRCYFQQMYQSTKAAQSPHQQQHDAITNMPYFPLFQSSFLLVYCWIQKDGMKRWVFLQVLCEKWKNTMNSPFFDRQMHPHSLDINRGRKSGRPKLAGSNMAVLFSLDSSNSEMVEIWASDLSGERTQWFFYHLQVWA